MLVAPGLRRHAAPPVHQLSRARPEGPPPGVGHVPHVVEAEELSVPGFSCHIRATSKAEQGATEQSNAEQRMCPELHVCQFAQVTALAQVDFPS